MREDLENLSLSLNSYASYLDDKNEEQQKRQKTDQPPRIIGENTWLETRSETTETVNPKYSLLDNTMRKLDCFEYVYFRPELHVASPFKSYSDKYHFIERISLSVPICILSYCPGSSLGKVVYLWRIPDVNANENLKSAITIYERLKSSLPEFHTRQMRKDFLARYCRLHSCSVPKHILRAIFSDLTVDSNAMQNPTVDLRVQQAIQSEDPDLVLDIRLMNPGRPNDTFNAFFEKLVTRVEEFSAGNDRRHDNICHF